MPSKTNSVPSNRQYILVKLMAMLSLVRWYNVLLITIGLYLSAIFLLNPTQAWTTTLLDYKLHFLIASINFFIMGGYIINAFYDYEKDLINNPETTIFGRVVSKAFCLNSYFLFNFMGTVLAAFPGWEVLLFHSAFCFALWFYSHKLRKKPFISELSAAFLTIAPFIGLSLYYGTTNYRIILYVGFLFAITLTREVLKKLVYLKGDLIYGNHTTPIAIGISKTKMLVGILMFLSLAPIGILFPEIKDRPVFYYLILSSLMILTGFALLLPAKSKTGFNRINTIYKVVLILSVFAIGLA